MELDDKVYQQITNLTDMGNEAFDDNPGLAQKYYEEALALVPEPKTDWEASTWLYVSIGDALFFKKEYESAIRKFNQAMLCPNGIGNAFINLRLGECYFELSDEENARNYLLQAYMLEGDDIFKNEKPKYGEFIQDLK